MTVFNSRILFDPMLDGSVVDGSGKQHAAHTIAIAAGVLLVLLRVRPQRRSDASRWSQY